MKPSKLQHRVTRTRVKGSKLPEFEVFYCPLWISRVLVDPNRSPSARAQEGLISLQCAVAVCQRLVAECPPHISRPLAKFFEIRFSGDDVLPWACSHAEER
jgi:hypothetical protein